MLRAGALVPVLAAALLSQGRGPALSPAARQAAQLDLAGQGTQARVLWQREIDRAPSPAAKAAAVRNLAMSWAFSGDCPQTVAYEKQVMSYWQTQEHPDAHNAFYQEGEMADEAARICIDLGALDSAAAMYQLGHERGLAEPGIAPGRRDLWEYRYQHALARLAARRGQKAEAERAVAAARQALAKMQSDDNKLYAQQVGFFPYLAGYVAFYGGDFKTALADFQQDTRRDPFISAMTGLCFEKLGDAAQARAAFAEAAKASAHNPPAAAALRIARRAAQ